MNIMCRNIHADMLSKGLLVQGYMPEDEAPAVADFLHWLMATDQEEYHTSSSDIAAVASCLRDLSFEVLSVKNFGKYHGHTPCRLVYNEAALYTGVSGNKTGRNSKYALRDLSTVVPLEHPEDSFSSFPIDQDFAVSCRQAWGFGRGVAKQIKLSPATFLDGIPEPYKNDVPMVFVLNPDSSVANQRGPRADPGALRLSSLLAVFNTVQLNNRLAECLGWVKASEDTLTQIIDLIRSQDDGEGGISLGSSLVDPNIANVFTMCQAFFMGYYYELFSTVVDTSMLEMKTVSGRWGYLSVEFFREVYKVLRDPNTTRGVQPPSKNNRDEVLIARVDVFTIVSILFANSSVELRRSTTSGLSLNQQNLCVGVISKRTVLLKSLLKDCDCPEEVCKFVVLDCDVGGIPRNPEGLVLSGVPSRLPTWEEANPRTDDQVSLHGAKEDFTRHIEADWDYLPDHMRLCIRYNGRRVGTLNPVHADFIFCMGFTSPCVSADETAPPEPSPSTLTFGPAHPCLQEDFVISRRLVTPVRSLTRLPVVVQSKGNPCMRYAAAAWYAAQDNCDVILVRDSGALKEAFQEWQNGKHWSNVGIQERFLVMIG